MFTHNTLERKGRRFRGSLGWLGRAMTQQSDPPRLSGPAHASQTDTVPVRPQPGVEGSP